MTDLFSYYRPDPYPAEPGFKDKDTSRLAARHVAGRTDQLRDQCLALVTRSQTGMTADEVAAIMGETVLSIRPRFSELLVRGRIRDSGQRRRNESGRSAKVWVAVTAQ